MKQKYYWIIGVIALLLVAGVFVFMTSRSNQEITVSWDEAIRILNSGQVQGVMQAHSLDVILTLKDGRTIYTKEPGIDDIFDEIKKCGNPCKDIIRVTE